jgi:hypothetical protein
MKVPKLKELAACAYSKFHGDFQFDLVPTEVAEKVFER